MMIARDGHHHSSDLCDSLLQPSVSSINFHSTAGSGQISFLSDQTTPQGKPEFVNLPMKYVCPFCKEVLKEAVQSECGHRYCNICSDSNFLDNVRVRCPFNEDDCIDLLRKEIYRDTSARKEVRLLHVYCTFKNAGCNTEIAWKDLLEHERICAFRNVECTYRGLGCPKIVTLKSIDSHTKHCKYRAINCKYCNAEIAKLVMKEHERTDCRKAPISCQFNCKIEQLPRENMEIHMIECPKRPKDCVYKSMGCDFKGTDEDIQNHEKMYVIQHLELTTMYAVKMDLEIIKVKRDFQSAETEREAYRRDLENLKEQCLEIRREEEGLKSGIKDTMVKIVAQTERVFCLERQTEHLATKSVVENHSRNIRDLKETMEKLTERISRIEMGGHRGGYTSTPSQEFTRNQANAIEQLKQQDRQIAIHDIRIAELDLRFQILETANYDGVLLWKIRDYARRKQEAISGHTLSLFSQPFYTNQFGYKMCARVYLNGDGSGKGTHLSLYFVVMRSEYDSLLQWPFRERITLEVLDQGRRGRNVSESFEPDVTSESYRRPTTEMNIATGCPQLISHGDLETTTYIKDDTMFLKVTVSATSGIQ